MLIIRTDDGMQHLLQSKFKLGADASAAAGPVGRDTQAATDLTMRAQVLTYSRSRGLFLGVSLSGAVIRQDDGDVLAFYGKDWTFYSLLNGEVPPPQDSQVFLKYGRALCADAPCRSAGDYANSSSCCDCRACGVSDTGGYADTRCPLPKHSVRRRAFGVSDAGCRTGQSADRNPCGNACSSGIDRSGRQWKHVAVTAY